MPKIDRPSRVKFKPTEEPSTPPEEDYAAADAAMEFSPEEDTTDADEEQTTEDEATAPQAEAPSAGDSGDEEPSREEREEELKALTLKDLKQIATSDYELPGGGTKPTLIKRILAHEFPPVQVVGTAEDDEEDATPTETPDEPSEAEETPKKRTRVRGGKITPSTRGTSLLFTPLEDIEEYTRVLYYGREGSGKTSNLLTMANQGRILFINAEGGVKKRALASLGINLSNVAVWPPEGQEITFESLRDLYFQIKSDLEDDPKSWYGVGFDSITDIVQGILDQVSTHRVDKTINRGVDVDLTDQFFVDRDDYGTLAKMMRKVMRGFRDLPLHLVYTALERRDVDEDTGVTSYGPALPPAVGTDLLGYVDLVLYCRAEDEAQDVFRAVSKKAGKYRVKDRNRVLPRVLVNPTMPRIIGYVDGTLTEGDDPDQAKLREEAPAATKISGKKTARRTTTNKKEDN